MKDQQVTELFEKTRILKQTVAKVMNKSMQDFPLTREQGQLLMILNEQSLNQKQLAKRLCISEPTISVRIKRLESLGLIKREAALNDKRQHQLAITEEGKRFIDDIQQNIIGTAKDIFDGIDDQEVQNLMNIYQHVIENCQRIIDQEL